MKIIANRLKSCMNKLVLPNQYGFILGRHGTNNVIITHELIHLMNNMKGSRSFIAIKIDLEKAHDKMDWSFLMETL